MRIFIDTNVFLSFYHLTSEDLEELKKLAVLIENKEVTLLLPKQVIDETRRNRASKINDSFEAFKKVKFTLPFPAYCKGYDQYDAMRAAQKSLEEAHTAIVKEIQRDIDSEQLEADLLLHRLFDIAFIIERTPEIVSKAKERLEIGNPPGKKGSLGDAINWESLIATVPEHGIIKLIADDGDFYSPLNSNKANEFLISEWEEKKKVKPQFFRKISSFFKEHYPDINLQTEVEKDALIESLAASPNFATTHLLIAKLSKYGGFTVKQVEDLVAALLTNNQISWIATDDDVKAFYSMIREKYFFVVVDQLEEIERLLEV